MKIKNLIKHLSKYDQNTELNFVIYSGDEDTDEYDLPIKPMKYFGEIDTSLVDDDNPRLTIGFKSPCLKYSYKKFWSFKDKVGEYKQTFMKGN